MIRTINRLAAPVGLALGLATAAQATEGYVALGYGAVQRGQGGAGVAQAGRDAMAATINPAAVSGLGHGFSLGAEWFMPDRGYDASGTFFVAPGAVRSGREDFLIPNFAYNLPLANGAVLNFAAYGNGGMNTSYADVANPNCGGGSGVFCGGAAGVDLAQLFVSVTYAQSHGALSWGVAPVLAVQRFAAKGLGAFGAASADAANLSDNGHEISTGYGLRAGVSYALTPGLRLGLAGQTEMKMSRFEDYAGLFEGQGGFDIPAQVSAGVAWDAVPGLTLLADYQKIFFSKIGAVGNATTVPLPFGSSDGPGFGWDDVEVVKLGAAWQQSDRLTLRAGYARATNPLKAEDVTLNILAPGVVKDHFTLGGSWAATAFDTLDVAMFYAPNVRVRGGEVTPGGPTPGQIAIDMDQLAFSLGWSHRF